MRHGYFIRYCADNLAIDYSTGLLWPYEARARYSPEVSSVYRESNFEVSPIVSYRTPRLFSPTIIRTRKQRPTETSPCLQSVLISQSQKYPKNNTPATDWELQQLAELKLQHSRFVLHSRVRHYAYEGASRQFFSVEAASYGRCFHRD